jgi:hypothetical protein
MWASCIARIARSFSSDQNETYSMSAKKTICIYEILMIDGYDKDKNNDGQVF